MVIKKAQSEHKVYKTKYFFISTKYFLSIPFNILRLVINHFKLQHNVLNTNSVIYTKDLKLHFPSLSFASLDLVLMFSLFQVLENASSNFTSLSRV